MRRVILWLLIGLPLVLAAVAAGAAAAVPTVRHVVSGVWNAPDRLPALADNSQVHYQQGAEDYAREVAGLLPAAMTRVESVHGRPFARPVPVGAYATPEAYVAANGAGSLGPVGTTFIGRVNLSPVLYAPQHRRLTGILTHELSHAHLQAWMSANAYVHLPNWFKEGLAVMVSAGGGAELVSEEEARGAIARGERITIDDSGSLWNLSEIRFDRPPQVLPAWRATVLAYRQAGMFVAYLHDTDGPAFTRMLNGVLDSRPFAQAVAAGYHEDIRSLWQKFVQAGPQQK